MAREILSPAKPIWERAGPSAAGKLNWRAMDQADHRAKLVEHLLEQVLVARQAYGGAVPVLSLPDEEPPTEDEARAALGHALVLLGKLLLPRADVFDAPEPTPLFALLGGLAEAAALEQAPIRADQRRRLRALLTLIEVAADVGLDVLRDSANTDGKAINSAIQVLVGGVASERHVLRMAMDCLREARREYQTASEEERATLVADVTNEIAIIVQRDATVGAKAAITAFLRVDPEKKRSGSVYEAASRVLQAGFEVHVSADSLDNAMQLRGKERLSR